MGAILLVGVIVAPTDEPAVAEPVVVQEEPQDVTVIQEETLELLDPIYSEKAVYQDGTIRIAFDPSYTSEGLESRLPFWLHNVSGDVINVLWDRCSLQLPNGNTVKILSENDATLYGGTGETISIAPSGDLFDAIIPATEMTRTDDAWELTTGVLDQGAFTLVLAIERSAGGPRDLMGCVDIAPGPDDCAPRPDAGVRMIPLCENRTLVYYTFRFIVR